VAEELRFGGEGLPVVEVDPVAPHVEVLLLHHPRDLHDVRLRDGALRVEEAVGERAVVRGEQRAARREVEAADREEAHAVTVEVRGHGGPALGVGQGGHDAPRLVEDHVDEVLRDDALPVELDLVGPRIGLGAELGDDLAVHADAARGDDVLRRAPRCDAATSQDLLKPFLCHRAGH